VEIKMSSRYNDWDEFIFFLFSIFIVLSIWGI